MGQTVMRAMKDFEVERKESISRLHDTMSDFKDNGKVAQEKLLSIVEEVRSSARSMGSPPSSQVGSPKPS
eukprot:6138625-Karenia_brevis.AAC.1